VASRTQAALDVVDGFLGPDVAGRHVGHGVAFGQCGVDVRRRHHSGRAVQADELGRIHTHFRIDSDDSAERKSRKAAPTGWPSTPYCRPPDRYPLLHTFTLVVRVTHLWWVSQAAESPRQSSFGR